MPTGLRPRATGFVQFRYSKDPSDVSLELDSLRVSTPARTVFDAASRLDESGLDRKLFVKDTLEQIGERLCAAGRPGTRMFRRLVARLPDGPPSQSEEELLLINGLRDRGWDVQPQYPVTLPTRGKVHLDAAVASALVDLEVDGPEHDRDDFAVHRDKSRDMQVAVVGWHAIRIPSEDVRTKRRVVLAMVDRICESRRALFERAARTA